VKHNFFGFLMKWAFLTLSERKRSFLSKNPLRIKTFWKFFTNPAVVVKIKIARADRILARW
jgi:hypothetical protein